MEDLTNIFQVTIHSILGISSHILLSTGLSEQLVNVFGFYQHQFTGHWHMYIIQTEDLLKIARYNDIKKSDWLCFI